MIGLLKTEVIRHVGPWKGVDDVELATLEWVWWFTHRRLVEPLRYLPPEEFEAQYLELRPHMSRPDYSNHRVPDKSGAIHRVSLVNPDRTPIEVASMALERHSAGDWRGLATLADQESLVSWCDWFVHAHTHVPTVEELAAECPEAPLEALERMREEDYVARYQRFEANLPRLVAGVRTAEALRVLDPIDLFVRYLEAHDPLGQLAMLYRDAYDAAALPLPELDLRREPLTIRPVLEEVMSAIEARVTLREAGANGEPIGPEVEWMLRRRPGGPWGVLVTDDFLTLPREVSVMIDDPVVSRFLQP